MYFLLENLNCKFPCKKCDVNLNCLECVSEDRILNL
jgi:hypothetical protein